MPIDNLCPSDWCLAAKVLPNPAHRPIDASTTLKFGGLGRLRDIAEKMEKAASAGDLQFCRNAVPALDQVFEQLRREMHRYREEYATLKDHR